MQITLWKGCDFSIASSCRLFVQAQKQESFFEFQREIWSQQNSLYGTFRLTITPKHIRSMRFCWFPSNNENHVSQCISLGLGSSPFFLIRYNSLRLFFGAAIGFWFFEDSLPHLMPGLNFHSVKKRVLTLFIGNKESSFAMGHLSYQRSREDHGHLEE